MKWRTKEGDIIDVDLMEDSHLNNCIKLVQKRIKTAMELGTSPKGSQETLLGLIKERNKRDRYAFEGVDISDMDEVDIERVISGEKRSKSFLDQLGEL